MALGWNKSKYHGAIESLILTMADYWYLDYHPVKTFTLPDDTTYILADSLFGFKPYFQLEVVPRDKTNGYDNGNRESYISRKELQIGYSFIGNNQDAAKLSPVNGDQIVFTIGCDSLYRYSLSEKQLVDRKGFSFSSCIGCSFNQITFSSSGKVLTSYTPCSREVVLIDATNFSSYVIEDLKSYTDECSFPIPITANPMGLLPAFITGIYRV